MAGNGIKTVSNVEGVGFGFVEKNNEVFVSIKEEPFVFLDDDDQNVDAGGEWAEQQLARPMEGLRERMTPPFLKKLLEMVDDEETNSIISWSFGKDSFIVWDPHKFCTDLMPKYFKHNNFSSFVRQLNTYQFRKMNPERWEFANEVFKQGKKHLLKHIRRRNHTSQFIHHGKAAVDATEQFDNGVDKLRDDYTTFRNEIKELKQQHQSSLHDLAAVGDRLRATETKQKQMVVFMIKSLKDPLFLQRFVDTMKQRRLGSDSMKTIVVDELASSRSDVEEKLMIESETQPVSSDDSGSSSRRSAGSLDVFTESFVLWDKVMEDEEISPKQHSVLVSELEDLISRPANGMVEIQGLQSRSLSLSSD